MIAVLLDEGLPLRSAQWLREQGVDATHAREIGLTSSADSNVLAVACAQQRVCFTLDHDFHAPLAETRSNAPSVVFLRMQQAGYVEIGRIILRVLAEVPEELVKGAAVTVTRRGIRLRRVPWSKV